MASNENGPCGDTLVALGLPETWPSDPASTATSDVPSPKNAVDLLKGLVRQTQLLACLHWLSEFQILAYVPLNERVAYNDLANLTGVPPQQIRRVVQTTATAGILYQPHPDSVAHTPLSAHLVNKPSSLDAVRFIAETVAPASLRMADATRLHMEYKEASPYQIATNFSLPLAVACEKDARIRRKATAFQRLTASNRTNALLHILSSVKLESLDQAVVEVNAASTAVAKALHSRSPSLRFVVQVGDGMKPAKSGHFLQRVDSSGWLKVQSRVPGTPQNERDAALYLLHIPDPFFHASSSAHAEVCVAELETHFDILRENDKATLILIAEVVPGTSGSPETEAQLQDLLLLQLGHDAVFDLERLKGLMQFARGDGDGITAVKQISSRSDSLVAFLLRSSTCAS